MTNHRNSRMTQYQAVTINRVGYGGDALSLQALLGAERDQGQCVLTPQLVARAGSRS